jgi:hypothetical protein
MTGKESKRKDSSCINISNRYVFYKLVRCGDMCVLRNRPLDDFFLIMHDYLNCVNSRFKISCQKAF